MSDEGYKIRDQHAVHFITFSVVQWVDVFTRPLYKDIVVDSIKYCQQNKGLNIHAWVIMSNHIHLICSATAPNKLSDVIRDLKKHTSVQLLRTISENPQESRKNWMMWIFRKAGEQNKRNEVHQFWQQGNHPIECSDADIYDSRINYLHQNPVKAGWVDFEGDYKYSSGIDYYKNEKGLIEITFLD